MVYEMGPMPGQGDMPVWTDPFRGGPAGFQNVVVPCAAVTDGGIIALTPPPNVQWFYRNFVRPQQVLGFIADATPTGDISISISGIGTFPVYSGLEPSNGVIVAGDYCQAAFDPALGADGGFQLINWTRSTSGFVASIQPGQGIAIDDTDPTAPIISVDAVAAEIPFTPTSTILATNTQSAIAEVDSRVLQFSSRAAAMAYRPTVAPPFIATAGYSTAGDGGAALYYQVVSQPANAGKLSITLQNNTVVWYALDPTEINAKQFGAVEKGVDTSAAIQAFFDFATTVKCGKATLAGDFNVSSGIVLNGASAFTTNFEFAATLRALGAIDTMVRFNNGNSFLFTGRFAVVGFPRSAWASRTCRIGFYVFNCGRALFGRLFAQYFTEWGVFTYGQAGSGSSNNGAKFEGITGRDCGSFSLEGLPANYSNPINSGGAGSGTQFTTITVDVLPPNTTEARAMLFATIGGVLYYIAAAGINDGAKTIQIFPWIDSTSPTSGTLQYIFGGAMASLGNDNGILDIGQVDALLCGMGFWDGALYGATARMVVAQTCGIGYILGTNLGSAHESSLVSGMYCEANAFDVIVVQSATVNATIICTYETAFAKMQNMASRIGGNVLQFAGFGRIGLTIIKDKVYSGDKAGANLRDNTNAPSIAALGADIYLRNTWTVNLTYSSDVNRLYGWDAIPLIIYGTGAFNNPTGAITFNPPVGWTVNGGASAVFTGFYGPANFAVKFITATLDVKVVLVTGREHPEAVTPIATDADATLTPWSTTPTVLHTGVLTADRVLTLATTNAVTGKTKYRITRTGSGAFNLSVGGLKNLVQNTWCDVIWNGSAFVLTGYGAL
jgi:hypothetical protein